MNAYSFMIICLITTGFNSEAAKCTSTYIKISPKSVHLGLQVCHILLPQYLFALNVSGNAVWACCVEIVCYIYSLASSGEDHTCWEGMLGSSLEALANNLSYIYISIHNRLRRVNIFFFFFSLIFSFSVSFPFSSFGVCFFFSISWFNL